MLESLQKYISFGYLYLIIMGILQESVFYKQIGVDILHYSTIADILISPIATLATKPVALLSVLGLSVFFYMASLFLAKNSHKDWVKKAFLKNKEHLSQDEVKSHFNNMFLFGTALCLLSFFFGIGIGSGEKLAERVANNELEYKTKVNFSDDKTEDVYLVESNSLYYFYFSKDNKNVKIAPIGTIKNIELIK